MKFTAISNKEELLKAAQDSESNSFKSIQTPGCEVLNIDQAILKSFNNSKAKSINFSVSMDDGSSGNFDLFVIGKDGKDTYVNKAGKSVPHKGVNQVVSSVLPFLGLDELETTDVTVDGKSTKVFRTLKDRKIGCMYGITISDKMSKDGKYVNTYYNMDFKGFFHPETRQTSVEFAEGTPAIIVDEKMKTLGITDKRTLQNVDLSKPTDSAKDEEDFFAGTKTTQEEDVFAE